MEKLFLENFICILQKEMVLFSKMDYIHLIVNTVKGNLLRI